jgi:hypothetical protein
MRRLDPNLPRDKNIKPLRTYESDVAEALARERTSVTTMAVAENLKRQQQKQVAVAEEEEIPEDEGTQGTSVAKKVLLFLLSLCFLGAGVIGAYYLYSKSPLAPPTPVQPDKPAIISLIPSDSYVLMPTENLNAISLKARIQREMEKSQPEGSIMEIIPTKVVEGQTMRVSAEEMVEIMDVEVPDILMRSLGQATMIGIYTPPRDARSIFAVVTTEFYQNTFAGMIQWESVMADDLKFFLFPDSVRGVANTTTDGVPAQNPQSSDTVAPLLTIRGKFVDRIIKNKDVRQFIADDGRILFMYSLVDNNKLVITDKEITLAEILTRLEKAASIR